MLLLAGAALVASAVLRGSASASIGWIFPLFAGSTALFLLGVLCLGIGFRILPFTLWDGGEVPEEEAGLDGSEGAKGADPPASGGFGGIVVIGPVPVLVGRWKDASTPVRWGIALIGLALLLSALYLAFPFRW
ncbi:MAG: DUF131 domain-containing protein [Thermoplasmata archaeon]